MASKTMQQARLARAEQKFLDGAYRDALREYALILKDNPLLEEAKVGAYLSDLGIESADEAQALFDYYQIIKGEQQNAAETIDHIITTLAEAKGALAAKLDPKAAHLASVDGISYSDFKALVARKGDFKRAFEDIMFSTKVIITEKKEFIDFVRQLIDEGFEEMALRYLDNTGHLFGNDQEILSLYRLIGNRIS